MFSPVSFAEHPLTIVIDPENYDLPSHPKFSWNIFATSWTNGCLNQESLAHAVKLREAFHDKFPASNFNRITADIRGICLKSQLFGRALDLTKGIADDVIASDQGIAAIVDARNKRNALSVVNEIYAYFIDILALHRRSKEGFKNCKTRSAS